MCVGLAIRVGLATLLVWKAFEIGAQTKPVMAQGAHVLLDDGHLCLLGVAKLTWNRPVVAEGKRSYWSRAPNGMCTSPPALWWSVRSSRKLVCSRHREDKIENGEPALFDAGGRVLLEPYGLADD